MRVLPRGARQMAHKDIVVMKHVTRNGHGEINEKNEPHNSQREAWASRVGLIDRIGRSRHEIPLNYRLAWARETGMVPASRRGLRMPSRSICKVPAVMGAAW